MAIPVRPLASPLSPRSHLEKAVKDMENLQRQATIADAAFYTAASTFHQCGLSIEKEKNPKRLAAMIREFQQLENRSTASQTQCEALVEMLGARALRFYNEGGDIGTLAERLFPGGPTAQSNFVLSILKVAGMGISFWDEENFS